MPNHVSLVGKTFGRLTVISELGVISGKGSSYWYSCLCECGAIKSVKGASLGRWKGSTKSCGCLQRDVARRRGKENRLKFGEAAFRAYYRSYSRRAKDKNIEFDLSIDKFKSLTEDICYYCKSTPAGKIDNKWHYGYSVHNGIDRIDNTRGYTLDNCVTCCKRCNQAKNDMTKFEFYLWIEKVYNRLKGELLAI